MTRLLLVRHGHVDWHDPERFRGRADLSLSELGRRQAERAAQRIAAIGRPDAIYTSPMRRTVATADAIAAASGLAPQPVAGLLDIDYGDWQGLTHDEAKAKWPAETARWFTTPHLAAIPRGEDLAAVSARASAALRDILDRHPAGTLVVVAHDSVNRVLLLFALGLPLARYWRFDQSACGINDFSYKDGDFVIHTINETQHLERL